MLLHFTNSILQGFYHGIKDTNRIWYMEFLKLQGDRNAVKIGDVSIRDENRETQLTPNQ